MLTDSVFLLPIFGGWWGRRHQSSSLSRLGGDVLFDVQILRHVFEYTAPLHFQERLVPDWVKSECPNSHHIVALSQRHIFVDDDEGFLTVIDTQNQTRVEIHVDIYFRLFVERHPAQIWRAQLDGGQWALKVCTLNGEHVMSRRLPCVPGVTAFHSSSQHMMVQFGTVLEVRTWPDWQEIATCELDHQCHVYRTFPHPSAPGWIIFLKNPYNPTRTGVATRSFVKEMQHCERFRTIQCLSLTLDMLHTIDVPGVSHIFLYRHQYILAFKPDSVIFLTLDLRVVNEIPHPFSSPEMVWLDQITGQTETFYLPIYQQPLRMFDLVPRGIKE